MPEGVYYHSIEIDNSACTGCMSCMRVCPTRALRVRGGKSRMISERCIDCGECMNVCRNNAILPLTDTFKILPKFEYTVALPSTVLYTQFNMDVEPSTILAGLSSIGFDGSYDISRACEAYNIVVHAYLEERAGKRPLISSTCPTIIRLIQVNHPTLTEHIIPLEVPREIAARFIRRQLSDELGIEPGKIGVIYITPCPAKMISIKQPAEKERSFIDGAISIPDIYNSLYSTILEMKKSGEAEKAREYAPSELGLNWARVGGMTRSRNPERWLSVSGLKNVSQVFDDIESGRIRDIDFIECFSCLGGCIGGSLTNENVYLARNKLIQMARKHRIEVSRESVGNAMKQFHEGFFDLENKLLPRKLDTEGRNILEAVERVKRKESIFKALPRVDCGLCGAPCCECFAEDVSSGLAKIEECVLASPDTVRNLIELYGSPSSSER